MFSYQLKPLLLIVSILLPCSSWAFRLQNKWDDRIYATATFSSPILMVSDGNGQVALGELGFATGAVLLGTLGDRQNAPLHELRENVMLGMLGATIWFHAAYPFWSLAQGTAAQDQGRILRALPVAGSILMAVGLKHHKSMNPDRCYTCQSFQITPWMGPEPGLVARLEF